MRGGLLADQCCQVIEDRGHMRSNGARSVSGPQPRAARNQAPRGPLARSGHQTRDDHMTPFPEPRLQPERESDGPRLLVPAHRRSPTALDRENRRTSQGLKRAKRTGARPPAPSSAPDAGQRKSSAQESNPTPRGRKGASRKGPNRLALPVQSARIRARNAKVAGLPARKTRAVSPPLSAHSAAPRYNTRLHGQHGSHSAR